VEAWTPPAASGVLAFFGHALTGGVGNVGTIFSQTAMGQHPWWESAGFNGDIGEVIQILNVTGHV
jgi:hypothetical protein